MTGPDSAALKEFERLYHQGGAFLSAAQLTRTPILVTDATDLRDPVIFANAAFLSFFGYAVAEVVGHGVEDLCDRRSCPVVATLRANLAEGSEKPINISLRRADGTETSTSIVMLAIRDVEGNVAHHFVSFLDRSETVAADAKVEALQIENARLVRELAARDLLVAETNHRVKNALMQASMVLMMEGARSKPEVADALAFARNRLEAMAGVYDLLSTGNAQAVDMGLFLGSLAPTLVPPLMPVAIEVELAQGVVMPPDLAQPLALVVVELVTNAVKHAFPKRRRGHIRVELTHIGAGIQLTVADNGVGMRGDATDSLGYKLVRGLVRQVGGRLNVVSSDQGAIVEVTVPEGAA